MRQWINLAGNDVNSAPEPKSMLGASALAITPVKVSVPAGSSVKTTLEREKQVKVLAYFMSVDIHHSLSGNGLEIQLYILSRPVGRVKPLVDKDLLEVEVELTNNTAKKADVTLGGDVRQWSVTARHLGYALEVP